MLRRWLLLSLPLLACTPEPTANPGASAPVGELRSAQIPSGFDFATTQTMRLRVRAGALTLPTGADAVEVRRTDGTVVFRGAIRAGVPLDLQLSLPAADREVDVVVGADQTVRAVRVAVDQTEISLDS